MLLSLFLYNLLIALTAPVWMPLFLVDLQKLGEPRRLYLFVGDSQCHHLFLIEHSLFRPSYNTNS